MTWADSNYKHKKLVTIDKDKVAGDDTDFPVLVSITDSDLTNCLANGYDIKFYNDDEDTQLKHERQEWDSSTGKLIAHVKIPSISSTSDTLFYIYYEYSGEGSDQADPENVWDANFMMVQHMIDTTTSTITDSTSNSNDGTKESANHPAVTTNGKIGDAQDFDGSQDYINCGTDSDLTQTGMTIELWCNTPADMADHAGLWTKGWDPGVYINAGYATANKMAIYLNSGGANSYYGNFFTINDWMYFTLIVATTTYAVYKDTVETNPWGGSETFSGDPSNSDDLLIGSFTVAIPRYFDGIIDEVRVSDVARTENWITTSYNSQDDPSAFMGFGSEEDVPITIKRAGLVYGLKISRIVKPGRIGP